MTTRPDPGRRVARLASVPIVVGPIVLAACWGGFNLANSVAA